MGIQKYQRTLRASLSIRDREDNPGPSRRAVVSSFRMASGKPNEDDLKEYRFTSKGRWFAVRSCVYESSAAKGQRENSAFVAVLSERTLRERVPRDTVNRQDGLWKRVAGRNGQGSKVVCSLKESEGREKQRCILRDAVEEEACPPKHSTDEGVFLRQQERSNHDSRSMRIRISAYLNPSEGRVFFRASGLQTGPWRDPGTHLLPWQRDRTPRFKSGKHSHRWS